MLTSPDAYRHLLAFHIVAVISWMAGILYLYRLLVYAAERRREHDSVNALLQVMSRRLFKAITLPAMIASWAAGLSLAALNPILWQQGWFHIKLFSLVLLTASTIYAGYWVAQVQRDGQMLSGKAYRVLNEVPTLLMIVIVWMVIVRPWA